MFDGLKWKFINTCYLFLKALKIEVNFSWRYTDKKVVLQTLIVWKNCLSTIFYVTLTNLLPFEAKLNISMYVCILHGSLRNSNILTKNSTKGLIRKKKITFIHKTSLLDASTCYTWKKLMNFFLDQPVHNKGPVVRHIWHWC